MNIKYLLILDFVVPHVYLMYEYLIVSSMYVLLTFLQTLLGDYPFNLASCSSSYKKKSRFALGSRAAFFTICHLL